MERMVVKVEKNITHNKKVFKETKNQAGFELDPLMGKKFEDVFIGGKKFKNI